MFCCSNILSTEIRLQLWSTLASASVAPQLGIKMFSMKLMTWTSWSSMWIRCCYISDAEDMPDGKPSPSVCGPMVSASCPSRMFIISRECFGELNMYKYFIPCSLWRFFWRLGWDNLDPVQPHWGFERGLDRFLSFPVWWGLAFSPIQPCLRSVPLAEIL